MDGLPPGGSSLRKTTLTWAEAAGVTAICFGLFILVSVAAIGHGYPKAEFSDEGVGFAVGLELVLGATALLFLRARGFDVASLVPRPTWRGAVVGVALYGATVFLGNLLVLLFVADGRTGIIEFSFGRLSLLAIVLFSIVNAAFEEVFLLGVLVRGLRARGLSIAFGLPLLVRALCHLYQGPVGVAFALIFGATMTLAYARKGDLWLPVFAHVLADFVPMMVSDG